MIQEGQLQGKLYFHQGDDSEFPCGKGGVNCRLR